MASLDTNKRLTRVNVTKLVAEKVTLYRSNTKPYLNCSWNLNHLITMCHRLTHWPRDPSRFVDSFFAWPTTHRPTVSSCTDCVHC